MSKIKIEKALEWLGDCENSTPETQWRATSKEDYRFYAGRQDTTEVEMILAEQNRPTTTFNQVKPKIDMLIGIAAQARSDGKILNVGSEDAPLAEILDGTLRHFRRRMRMKQKEQEAFSHTVKSGRSLIYYWIDRSNPFKPVPVSKRIPGFQFGIDPESIELDLSDARYLYIDKWIDEDEYKELFPQATKEVISSIGDRYQDAPDFFNEAADKYRIVELWYKTKEKVVWFINPVTEKEEWLFPKDFINFRKTLLEGIPGPDGQMIQIQSPDQIPGIGTKKDIYRYIIFSADEVFEEGVSPYKHDGYPAVLYGAYKDDDNNTWFGAVTMTKDPQRALNTVRRQLVHLLQTLPKGILAHETGSIVNIEEYEDRGSEPNFHLELTPGKFDRYRFETQPAISPIYSQLDMTFDQGIKDVSGIQNEMLGIQQSSREAGVSVQLRQQSGLTVLYLLYDNYQDSRIRGNKLLLSLIQQYITYQTVVRIEGEKGIQLLQVNSQINPQAADFNDISVGEYDIVVDEVDESPTSRMMISRLLAELNQNNPGMIPPDIILEYANAPFTVKQRVKASWEAMMLAQEARANAEAAAKVSSAQNKPTKGE
ncbi:MAG: hypothetical protein U9N61_12705 [Euryarchaeota archaeon]|nr:hypothetical protein [Euryarchaeota archaeon]